MDAKEIIVKRIARELREATVTMANIAYNLARWQWWESRIASA